MTSRGRSLLKKMRNKSKEERRLRQKESGEGKELLDPNQNNPRNNPNLSLSVPKPLVMKKHDFIDPLDFFKEEHLVIKPANMDEYKIKEEDVIKESDKEEQEKTPKGAEGEKKEKGEKVPVGAGKMGGPGGMGGGGMRINFAQIMKARMMVKKKDDDVSLAYKKKQEEEERKRKILEEKKKKQEEREKRLLEGRTEKEDQDFYVRLVLARNRYQQRNEEGEELFTQIINLANELKNIDGVSQEILKEIETLLSQLELPERIVMVDDVQNFIPENDFIPLIKSPVNMDKLVRSNDFKGAN